MTPTPRDRRRELLATAWQNSLDLERSSSLLKLSIPIQIVQGTIYYIFRVDERMALPIVLTAALLFVFNAFGMVAAYRRRRAIAVNVIWISSIANSMANMILLYVLWQLVGTSPLVVAYGMWVAVTTLLSVMVNPPSLRHLCAYLAAVLTTYAGGIPYAPHEAAVAMWFAFVPIVLIGGTLWALALARQTKNNFHHEYDRLRAVTPAAIMDAMIKDPKGKQAEFRPTRRDCICICSDWRGYQKMTAGMTDDTVVAALEHYYNAIDGLLEAAFPLGNHFSDWIADELFVVVFQVDGTSAAEMAAQAVRFATSIIEARPTIAERHGVPLALDIGLSFGAASVGIMGSDSHRKATALGETPGRARRLQTAGKLLRQAHGDQDRVILENALVALLPAGSHVRTHVLATGETIQDMPTRTLHYLENAPQRVAA